MGVSYYVYMLAGIEVKDVIGKEKRQITRYKEDTGKPYKVEKEVLVV